MIRMPLTMIGLAIVLSFAHCHAKAAELKPMPSPHHILKDRMEGRSERIYRKAGEVILINLGGNEAEFVVQVEGWYQVSARVERVK